MLRTSFLAVMTIAILGVLDTSQAQTADQAQKGLTCQLDEAGMESALARRIGGLGVTIGDYQNCVSFCKGNFPADSTALIECIKGCRDVKAAPTAVILR
jgi:hypothetical protein